MATRTPQTEQIQSGAVGNLANQGVLAETHFAKALVGVVIGVEPGDADGFAAASFIEGGFVIAIHSQELCTVVRRFELKVKVGHFTYLGPGIVQILANQGGFNNMEPEG